MGRTNIDIDDELMAAAMRATGLKTKKAVVEEGLRGLAHEQRLRQALERLWGIGWEAPEWQEREFAEDGTVYYPDDKT
jgi:Arc/MetJ family transcription regulator